MPGRHGGVRLAVRVHLWSVRQATERSVWLEPRGNLAWLRIRGAERGHLLPHARPLAGSLRPSAGHPSLRDVIWLRHSLPGVAAFTFVAVLRHLHFAGRGWKRRRSPFLRSSHLHLVSTPARNGAGVCHAGRGLGRDDPAAGGPNHHQPIRLACCLSVTWGDCFGVRSGAHLGLRPRASANTERSCSRSRAPA